MKTLVGHSAGVESTALAYKLLRETTDEVILLYMQEEQWIPGRLTSAERATYISKEERCFHRCVRWLKDNVRDVTSATARPARLYDIATDPKHPVRRGFTHTFPFTTDKNGYSAWAKEANERDVGRVVFGYSTWDTHIDHSLYSTPLFTAITNVALEFPLLNQNSEGDGMGRFEAQSIIPPELSALTIQCLYDPPCGTCPRCLLNIYYRENCTGKTLVEIQAVDDIVEQDLCLGKYRDRANPATYSAFDRSAYMTHEYYRSLIKRNLPIIYTELE